MKEYLVHGTKQENLIKILQDGYIDNKPSKKDIIMLKHKPSNQIFTQFIYKDIPKQEHQFPHWWNSAIILDKSILKDYPFYSTGVGGFSDKFENGMKNETAIIHSDGNLSKMPNLTKLKNHINKFMEKDIIIGKGMKLYDGGIKFMHSHEILFNQKIPLDKYCIAIIMYKYKDNTNTKYIKELNKISELAKEKNIPLKIIDISLIIEKKKIFNELINIIESN
jgi:hypothetical protein